MKQNVCITRYTSLLSVSKRTTNLNSIINLTELDKRKMITRKMVTGIPSDKQLQMRDI